MVPALSQPLVLPWAGQGSPNSPLQGPEQLSCLPQPGASIWRNRLPDPAYAFTQQQYVQEPLIQHSSLLPKRSTNRLKLLCSQIPLAASSPCLIKGGEGSLLSDPLPQLDLWWRKVSMCFCSKWSGTNHTPGMILVGRDLKVNLIPSLPWGRDTPFGPWDPIQPGLDQTPKLVCSQYPQKDVRVGGYPRAPRIPQFCTHRSHPTQYLDPLSSPPFTMGIHFVRIWEVSRGKGLSAQPGEGAPRQAGRQAGTGPCSHLLPGIPSHQQAEQTQGCWMPAPGCNKPVVLL